MGGGSGRGLSFGATVGSGELPLEYKIESGVMPKLAEKGHRIHFVRFSDDEREEYEKLVEKFPHFALSSCGGLHGNIPLENAIAYVETRLHP